MLNRANEGFPGTPLLQQEHRGRSDGDWEGSACVGGADSLRGVWRQSHPDLLLGQIREAKERPALRRPQVLSQSNWGWGAI